MAYFIRKATERRHDKIIMLLFCGKMKRMLLLGGEDPF
jgi:hypothetical protein